MISIASKLRALFLVAYIFTHAAIADEKPDVMLAKIYRGNIDISQYWVSEKFDGVRAR